MKKIKVLNRECESGAFGIHTIMCLSKKRNARDLLASNGLRG